MSIYPDWIGVDTGTGSVVIVDAYDVEFEDQEILVQIESDIVVEIENEEVNVEYGD